MATHKGGSVSLTATITTRAKALRRMARALWQLARANYATWARTEFFKDISVIAISILLSVVLVWTGVLSRIIEATSDYQVFSVIIAGFFFTSIFTTAPAIAALGEIAQGHSLPLVALFGALGAMLGDYIIFRFMRDTFSVHIAQIVQLQGARKRLTSLLKLRSFRWITFLVGGAIIASPLPDELGLSLLGFSKVKTSLFLPLSFVFNFLGIFLIGLAAQALA